MGFGAFAAKIKGFFTGGGSLDEGVYEDLCDLLVEGDFGAALAMETVDTLKLQCKKEGVKELSGAKELLASLLTTTLNLAPPPPLLETASSSSLTLAMLLGVNGVGKTTSAAKLAARWKDASPQGGGGVVLAAGDTFRAAAIDQLIIHGERLSVRVVSHQSGADSAAVVFDALKAARSSGASLVIADTAGRMHTKTALVEELKKIDRVAGRFGAESPLSQVKYLVLDATTGTNALSQAEVFNEAVHVDGVILTKYDSSAKGGVVFPLAAKLRLTVSYICTGERYTDIAPFDAERFVKEFLGN